MDAPHQNNAMTEIALALAMGFFSIMVLSMISLGTGNAESGPEAVPAAALTPARDSDPARGARPLERDDTLIVFFRGRFYDRDLRLLADTMLKVDDGRRAVLAVAPGLSFKATMAARERVAAADLVVAPLSNSWITRLEELAQ